MQLFWIALAGIGGVLSRYFISLWIMRVAGPGFLGTEFPYTTVLINVLGSFLVGLVYVWGFEREVVSEAIRIALIVGLLGGFTTFSSFSLETVKLIASGQWGIATMNVLSSVVFCLIATAAGLYLARSMSS